MRAFVCIDRSMFAHKRSLCMCVCVCIVLRHVHPQTCVVCVRLCVVCVDVRCARAMTKQYNSPTDGGKRTLDNALIVREGVFAARMLLGAALLPVSNFPTETFAH